VDGNGLSVQDGWQELRLPQGAEYRVLKGGIVAFCDLRVRCVACFINGESSDATSAIF
jgi:hypothetical protein